MSNSELIDISDYKTPKHFYYAFKDIREKRIKQNLPVSQLQTFKKEERAIQFKDYSLKYGENPDTLFKINLQIPKRKITAIIGPSGCGKSSLLRSINRMNEEIANVTSRGKIIVNGVNEDYNIYKHGTDVLLLRNKVGMVFQKPQPFPRSIYDNITFGPKLHGIKQKKQLDKIVNRTLTDVGLIQEVGNRLGDHAFSLSGGQQQRLCVARTLAVNPSVILCDEPASALDPRSTAVMERLLLRLKEKYTVVIVTHNMQQARRISDYSFLMYNGVVVEFGNTERIFDKPVYTLTKNYISGKFG